MAHLLGGFTEMSFEGFKIHEVSVLCARAETTKLHVFEHFVMKVRQKNHFKDDTYHFKGKSGNSVETYVVNIM